MTTRRRRSAGAVLLLSLAGPAGGASFYSPCCYNGEVAGAELSALELRLGDGSTRPVPDAFPGLLDGAGGPPLYAYRWRYLRKTGTLAKLAESYDANDDGFLDHQELLVLVIVEMARASSVDATGLERGGQPVRALAIPAAEVEQLTGWLRRNDASLDDQGASLLLDVELLRNRRRPPGAGSGGGS